MTAALSYPGGRAIAPSSHVDSTPPAFVDTVRSAMAVARAVYVAERFERSIASGVVVAYVPGTSRNSEAYLACRDGAPRGRAYR